MRKNIMIITLPVFMLAVSAANAQSSVASAEYVNSIVNALGVPEISAKIDEHISDTENPHAVTAAHVGLGNVKNIDTTNADNIVAGTVNIARLPVGASAETVASGSDSRFDSLPSAEPSGPIPEGRVYVWFN